MCHKPIVILPKNNIRIICKGENLEDIKVIDADTGESINKIQNINIDIDVFEGVTAQITFLNPELDIDITIDEGADDEEGPVKVN